MFFSSSIKDHIVAFAGHCFRINVFQADHIKLY